MSLYSKKNPAKNYYTGKEKALPRNDKYNRETNRYSRFLYKGTPRCFRLPAVFTVEAALILPLLACFFVSILFFFRIMQVDMEVQKALNDTGRKLAVYLSESENDSEKNFVAAKALFLKEMAGREAAETYITGGSAGISLRESKFTGDEIDLHAHYSIKLPIRIFWKWKFDMVQYARCRKWNGWNGGNKSLDEDVWVYIAQTGTVYHTISTCTHLRLSIRSVDYEQVKELRSDDGGRYVECDLCAERVKPKGKVYITNQGNCYHCDLDCSGIKRTVLMIRLSEVGARRACSRCSGEATRRIQ